MGCVKAVLHSVLHLFTVEMREVKEIRIGKQSKDFEKWPEDAKRIENLRCFVVYYSSEFRLKTLSISGKCYIYIYCHCCLLVIFTLGPLRIIYISLSL